MMMLAAFSFGCDRSERTSKTGERATVTNAADKSVALPADFPKDMPILRDATVKVAISQGERMIVHLYTSASIADAAKFYDAELKGQGWKIESTTHAGEMLVFSAKKGKTVCGVTVTKEGKRTLVRIAISQAGS
jgi:hypothetical protein